VPRITIKENEDPMTQLAVRLPRSLVERLEGHAARMRHASPGVSISRVDAIRALLNEGLARAERDEHKKA
jgi:hypothetical protein